ncbi:MAG: DUF4358 domain-containing protein [Clostridiales bacterium]|nr:DUF4358 domain-containing protein [Clostridiales bacterium]
MMGEIMKKIITLVLVLTTIMTLAACGGGTQDYNPYTRDLDEDAFAATLLAKIEFGDIMTEVDDDAAGVLYSLYGLTENDYDDLSVYMSTGATAEEIAVISVENEDQAAKVGAVLVDRIDAQIKSYENYAPDEVEKLSNAIVEQVDDVVILIVCEDYEQYRTAKDDFLKNAAVD